MGSAGFIFQAVRFQFCESKTGELRMPMTRRDKIAVQVLFFGCPFPILRRQNWQVKDANGRREKIGRAGFISRLSVSGFAGKTGGWGTPMDDGIKITVLVLFSGRPLPILRGQNWKVAYANGRGGLLKMSVYLLAL